MSSSGKKRVITPPFRSLRDLRIASLVGTGGASHRNAGFLGISLQSFIKKNCFLSVSVSHSLYAINRVFSFQRKQTQTLHLDLRKKKQKSKSIRQAVADTEWRRQGCCTISVSGSGRRVRRLIERDAGFRATIFSKNRVCPLKPYLLVFFVLSVSPLPQSSCSILFFTTFSISDLLPKDIMPALSS